MMWVQLALIAVYVGFIASALFAGFWMRRMVKTLRLVDAHVQTVGLGAVTLPGPPPVGALAGQR